ncbi:lipid-A-disaccharide synthase, partial [Klebsiella pneumoniae]|nr:lipid-A-disaccharide synthase [Klebsiella pneumoniae]
ADELPLENDRGAAPAQRGLPEAGEVLAVLPRSRASEIRFLGETFLAAAERLCAARPELSVVIPAATPERRGELEALL